MQTEDKTGANFPTVYLCGGFKTNWHEKIKTLKGFKFYDPRIKEQKIKMNVEEYGAWDLFFLRKSDIVFVYVERTNTSCIGLSVECGFAKALNKTIIMVLEPNHETIKDSYLQFLKLTASVVFEDLDTAINYFKTFSDEAYNTN